MSEQSMTDTVRKAVVEAGATRELARRLARRYGWTGSERAWVIRTSQMLGRAHYRHFPADGIPDAIEVTGDVSILAPAHAAVIRVQARADQGRAPLAKVRPGQGRAKRA